MYRILVADCRQEISSFNPVLTRHEDFTIRRGEELLSYHRGIESEVSGAQAVFGEREDVELVPIWEARANSSGPLFQTAFDRLAAEFTELLAAGCDGAHGGAAGGQGGDGAAGGAHRLRGEPAVL